MVDANELAARYMRLVDGFVTRKYIWLFFALGRCVFEGRDGAEKGGTIEAITERVSPRVFRVVALPPRKVN